MPIRYNISAQYLQPRGGESLGVAPAEGFDFTDEEAASLGCEWTDQDPRSGLAGEIAFKTKRDQASPAPSPDTAADAAIEQPAVSGEEEAK